MRGQSVYFYSIAERWYSVRAITADFGFSFALPSAPSIPQLQPPTEPPAKRRKTNESISPKRRSNDTPKKADIVEVARPSDPAEKLVTDTVAEQHENQPERTNYGNKETNTIGVIPTEHAPKPTKKPRKPQRKFCLDGEVEQAQTNAGETQTGGPEDTFIFGVKPKKQQPKSKPQNTFVPETSKRKVGRPATKGKRITKAKQAAEDKAESDANTETLEQETGPLSTKGKKTTKAKQQLEDKIQPDSATEPATEIARLEEKAKAPKSRAVASKPTATIAMDTNILEVATVEEVNLRPDDSAKLLPVADVLPEDVVNTKPKSAKVKAALKRTLKRSIEEVVTNIDGQSAASPEKAAKRPRRQAAISATEKVALGYEDDLIDVDKLRRAPDVEVRTRKSRKAATSKPSAVAQPSPLDVQAIDVTEKNRSCNKDETPSSPPLVVKRGRKAAVKATKSRDSKVEEKLEGNDPQPTQRALPSEEADTVPGDEPTRSPKPPAKRGRKPGVKARKINDATNNVEPAVEPVVQPSEDPTAACVAKEGNTSVAMVSEEPNEHDSKSMVSGRPRNVNTGTTACHQETSHVSHSLGEQLTRVSSVEERPTKKRRALADFDGNIVRKSSTVESEKPVRSTIASVSPPVVQRSNSSGTRKELQTKSKPARLTGKAQPVELAKDYPDNEPSQQPSTASKKRHVIAAEEDLDWLFEKPETKRSRPAAIRHPTTKTRRKESDQNAKDMDLDDLLASIAGFSGKLLTGRRGRTVAN